MAENIKEESIFEEIEIKKEEVFIREEICSSSSLQDICTWDVQEEYFMMENTKITGNKFVYINEKFIFF